ncbi:hypothetical protein NXC24_PC01473 (plasmid) [Rhizobium sp. NXC24]|nr:hypothetical protein NXC24_PC01473 [Rhizobium sp. NXC24]
MEKFDVRIIVPMLDDGYRLTRMAAASIARSTPVPFRATMPGMRIGTTITSLSFLI